MERGSDKHSARLDEAMSGEVDGLLRGGHQTHAEEFKQAEPSGEDQPDVDLVPDGALHGGVPAGMTEDDVERRSRLALYLPRGSFPMVRQLVLDTAAGHDAPEAVLADLRQLPAGREFASVGEVFTALGGREETRRF